MPLLACRCECHSGLFVNWRLAYGRCGFPFHPEVVFPSSVLLVRACIYSLDTIASGVRVPVDFACSYLFFLQEECAVYGAALRFPQTAWRFPPYNNRQ